MKRDYHKLILKENTLNQKIKELIIKALRANSGRIVFKKTEDNDDYPLTIMLSMKKDIYFISVTDVYFDQFDAIYIDGIDDTGVVKKEFMATEDQYSDVLYFIGYALEWCDANTKQSVIDETNSVIMELACQLAEKEMVDKHNWLPEAFMDETGENYTDDFQEEFDPLYDNYYDSLSKLMDFELRPA